VELSKLLEAFQNVLSTAESEVREILVEEIPVEVRIREILDMLQTQPHNFHVGVAEAYYANKL
jgi:hypothetical protein